MAERTYDVVVWGATGFTGLLAAEYMYLTYGLNGDVKWAIAGRDSRKLNELNQNITGSDVDQIPQLIADSNDETSLRQLLSSTKVVCSTVGPYAILSLIHISEPTRPY